MDTSAKICRILAISYQVVKENNTIIYLGPKINKPFVNLEINLQETMIDGQSFARTWRKKTPIDKRKRMPQSTVNFTTR
jgi:hypothetical protein